MIVYLNPLEYILIAALQFLWAVGVVVAFFVAVRMLSLRVRSRLISFLNEMGSPIVEALMGLVPNHWGSVSRRLLLLAVFLVASHVLIACVLQSSVLAFGDHFALPR